MVKEFDSQNFDAEVTGSAGVVIVDYFTTACGPCRAMAPLLEKVAGLYDGLATFGKVNVGEAADLAVRAKITAVPTFVVYVAGSEVDRRCGLMSEDEFRDFIEGYV